MDLKLKSSDGGDISTYVTNGEWALIGTVVNYLATNMCLTYPLNVIFLNWLLINYAFSIEELNFKSSLKLLKLNVRNKCQESLRGDYPNCPASLHDNDNLAT